MIMPCYSFLEDLYEDSMRYDGNVTIYVETRWGGRQELEVPIFWVQYEVLFFPFGFFLFVHSIS